MTSDGGFGGNSSDDNILYDAPTPGAGELPDRIEPDGDAEMLMLGSPPQLPAKKADGSLVPQPDDNDYPLPPLPVKRRLDDGDAGTISHGSFNPPDSDDEEDSGSDVDFDFGALEKDSLSLQVQFAGGHEQNQVDFNRITCDGVELAGRSFRTWIKSPNDFVNHIMGMPLVEFAKLIEENENIERLYTELTTYVDMSAGCPHYTTIEAEMQTIRLSEARYYNAMRLQELAKVTHWARTTMLVEDVISSLLVARSIRKPHTWAVAFVVLRIYHGTCSKVNSSNAKWKNMISKEAKLTAKAIRKADKDKKNKLLSRKIQSGTIVRGNVDATRQAQAATNTVTQGSEKKRQRYSKLAVQPALPAPQFADPDSDEEEEQSIEREAVAVDDLTDEQIFEFFFRNQLAYEMKARGGRTPEQVAEAGRRSLLADYERMQKLRVDDFNHHFGLTQRLILSTQHHLKDFHTLRGSKPKRILKAIVQEVKDSQDLIIKTGLSLVGGLIEEGHSEHEQDILGAEEASKAIQQSEGVTDDTLAMCDIPQNLEQSDAMKLFLDTKIAAGFSPNYLGDACRELGITDMNKLFMPNAKKALRWWQAIFTKWILDLPLGEESRLLAGGILADYIGLGKTFCSIATVVKMVNIAKANASKGIKYQRVTEYEEPGEVYRPSIYVAPASLCPQICDEFVDFSEHVTIVHVGGDPKISRGNYKTLSHLPEPDSEAFDTTDIKTLSTIYVISYNYFSKHYGREEYWRIISQNKDAYVQWKVETDPAFDKNTFDFRAHSKNFLNQPMECPEKWMTSYAGKFCYVFCDEAQESLRNEENAFWQVVKWLKPVQTILMTGYPAPRGMQDYTAYIKLLERPSLLAEALCEEARDRGYIHGSTNPYNPDATEYCKRFRFLASNWRQFIVNHTDSDDSATTRALQTGKRAQETLTIFTIRRDFNTCLDFMPGKPIGSNLPPKFVYTVERLYSPSALRMYNNQNNRWVGRMMTALRNTRNETTPATNLRSLRASQMIEYLPFLGVLHVESKTFPKPGDPGGRRARMDREILDERDFPEGDEKYNRDRESFFYDNSPIYQTWSKITDEDGKPRGQRLRWLIDMCRKADVAQCGFSDITDNDWFTAPLGIVLQEILDWSPKLQSMLAIYADFCLAKDEKVIFWFNTPFIQEISQMIFEYYGYTVFSVYGSTSPEKRTDVTRQWNNTLTKTRALFASARVFGTGFNLQKDSHVACLVDATDTRNREIQLQGRQHRGGQAFACYFFRLVVKGGFAQTQYLDNLLTSMASTASFMNFLGPEDQFEPSLLPEGAPEHIVEAARENIFSAFIRTPKSGCTKPVEQLHETDYEYFYIFGERGMELVKQGRADDPDRGDDWWPETLPWPEAVRGIFVTGDSVKANRTAGFVTDRTQDIEALTELELSERRAKRIRDYGNDPDNCFYPEKKSKAKKAGHSMERTGTLVAGPTVNHPEEVSLPSSRRGRVVEVSPQQPRTLPNLDNTIADLMRATAVANNVNVPRKNQRGSDTLPDTNGRIVPIPLQDNIGDPASSSPAQPSAVNGSTAKGTETLPPPPPADDESDMTATQIIEKARSDASYRPIWSDVQHLSKPEKQRITREVKTFDRDFKGLAKPSSKGRKN